MNISVVIPTNGDRDLTEIIEHLKKEGFEDINIVKNDNDSLYERYSRAKTAKFDTIYTQDDDCIISNIKTLVNEYCGELTCNGKRDNIKFYKNKCEKISLVGWGAIFDRKHIKVLDEFLEKVGDNDLTRREADRIFTYLNEKQVIVADEYIKDLPCAFTGMSSKQEHWESLDKIIKVLEKYEKT
jgi:hypothetical protein